MNVFIEFSNKTNTELQLSIPKEALFVSHRIKACHSAQIKSQKSLLQLMVGLYIDQPTYNTH